MLPVAREKYNNIFHINAGYIEILVYILIDNVAICDKIVDYFPPQKCSAINDKNCFWNMHLNNI